MAARVILKGRKLSPPPGEAVLPHLCCYSPLAVKDYSFAACAEQLGKLAL